MSDPRIQVSFEGPVATITVMRPEKLNAFDIDMLKALDAACDQVEANGAVRAAIITGGGKAFSAGGDIKAWAGMEPNVFGHAWVRFGHRVFDRLAGLRVPVVAALNGHALGGGLEFAATADIRIAEPQVKLGMPETGLGMVPGWSGTQRLVRRFGAQTIRRMVLGGEIFGVAEALSLGLIDRVAGPGAALAEARSYALRIAARGPAAVEVAKLMLTAAENEDTGAAVEALGSMLVAGTADLQEGVAAFGEKREPLFKGDWG